MKLFILAILFLHIAQSAVGQPIDDIVKKIITKDSTTTNPNKVNLAQIDSTKTIQQETDSTKKETITAITPPTPPISSIKINNNMLAGRWYEVLREVDGKKIKPEHPDFYMFRTTGRFHIGESNAGVILFNRAGKYEIKHDTVETSYLLMLSDDKPQYIHLDIKVIAIEGNEISTYMTHKDETPIFVRLKRAGSK